MLEKNILLDARGKKSVQHQCLFPSISHQMHIVPCNSIWTGIHVDGFTSSTVLLLDTSHKDSQCIELVHGAY